MTILFYSEHLYNPYALHCVCVDCKFIVASDDHWLAPGTTGQELERTCCCCRLRPAPALSKLRGPRLTRLLSPFHPPHLAPRKRPSTFPSLLFRKLISLSYLWRHLRLLRAHLDVVLSRGDSLFRSSYDSTASHSRLLCLRTEPPSTSDLNYAKPA